MKKLQGGSVDALRLIASMLACCAAASGTAFAQVPGAVQGSAVTFAKDIAPIFQNKCESCHRRDGMAPMPLVTFEDVRPWARAIKTKVADRLMPPWYVDRTIGIQKFANDRSLSDEQIETIVRWVDEGAPLGDRKDLPAPKAQASEDGWTFSSYFKRPPDLIVRSPEYVMPAVSQDRWWEVRGTLAIPEDRWVAGTETRPALKSRRVVHHATAMLFQKESAEFVKLRDSVREGNFDPAVLKPGAVVDDPSTLVDPPVGGASLSEWAVGKNGELYVEHDAGQFLRAGSEIGWDVHLNAVGENTPVTVEMAFWFYPKGTLPKYRAMMNAIGNSQARNLEIPPGKVTRFEAYTVLPAPAILLNFQPHMHFRGKAFSMSAIYPDGRTEILNYVPRYAFNWHINYVYAKDSAPVLPKGTVIKTTAWHDNTPANKSNPDPTQWVTYGQRSVDEMAHANEVVLYITEEDYQRIVAERKQASGERTQQQQ